MISLRHAAEIFSRGKSFQKRLPPRFGGFNVWCSPENNLRIMLPGERGWDTRLFGYVDRFVNPGDVVWDIGANMGAFTFAAASKAAAVVAIEPDGFNLGLLKRTVQKNPWLVDVVQIIGAAVSDHDGLAQLRIARRGRSANSISGATATSQAGGFREIVECRSVTLDSLSEVHPAPHLIKIDAEGAEEIILAGGRQMIAQHRPRMIVEVSAATVRAVTRKLAALGYSFGYANHPDIPMGGRLIDFDLYATPLAVG